MMSKYFICCETCFQSIGEKNTKCARLWMDICASKLEYGEIVKSYDLPEIKELEEMGFIISTEQNDYIKVKIQGHIQTHDGENFFCIKEGRHE